jgi:hypothetical protein
MPFSSKSQIQSRFNRALKFSPSLGGLRQLAFIENKGDIVGSECLQLLVTKGPVRRVWKGNWARLEVNQLHCANIVDDMRGVLRVLHVVEVSEGAPLATKGPDHVSEEPAFLFWSSRNDFAKAGNNDVHRRLTVDNNQAIKVAAIV